MTIYSMTGFGVACAPTPSGLASVELRSVNNRFFEFSARLPDECKAMDQSLREALASLLPSLARAASSASMACWVSA